MTDLDVPAPAPSLLDEVRASLDRCVKCTICETACPVAQVTPLFPGPKYEGPQAERFRLPDVTADRSVDWCSGCGICTQVCPQGVKVAELNSRARARYKAEHGVRLRDRLIARPDLMGRLGAPVAPLVNAALRNRPARRLLEAAVGISRSAPLPTLAPRSFRSWSEGRADRLARSRSGRTVVYFSGCSTTWFEPDLGRRTVAVLARNGIGVRVPRQQCCGLPLQSNGLFDGARRALRRLARDLDAPGTADDVVATSTSCGLMLKHEGREVLGLLQDAVLEEVGGRTYDICEYLLDLHAAGLLDLDLAPVDRTVLYHGPCQLRGHGIGTPAMDLLALVPGLKVVESEADCCGMAGTYGLKREKRHVAMAVGAGLFDQVRDSGADAVVCDSETCRWQIAAATGRPAVHPVEILFEAYGLEP
ncbi:MAG: anaerobic glycerol-3-phosphate dehydrogenase subunit C [Actinomycetota bacterium]